MWIATAEEMREIDRRAIQEFGIPSSALMEQAGFAVFHVVQEFLSKTGRATIVCGKGNNGGDGMVVARLLREHGRAASCFIAAESEEDLSREAREQLQRAVTLGVKPIFASDDSWITEVRRALNSSEVAVDALLGTGASGDVEGLILSAVETISDCGKPIVSVDIPTGVECDTGREMGKAVRATRTVTFGLPKPYLFQGAGLEKSGRWTVSDIGYPAGLLGPTRALLLSADLLRPAMPKRPVASNKGQSGSLLIVAGSREMPGAAIMAAKAALRCGAGLITVASVESVCNAVSHHMPEAMLMVLPERDGKIGPDAAPMILELQQKVDAAVFGPGLSQVDSIRDFLAAVWRDWHQPAILDADALNLIATGLVPPEKHVALTPHPGELARLLQCTIAEIQADRFAAARLAADVLKHPTLIKGAYTIAASPNQPLFLNPTGNSGMASGGMGDVLSGIVGTLLAQKLTPADALGVAAFWHGLAGDLCASEIGPVGYGAMDLIERLPRARASILG
jgi:ADP-dependent NAD(P)H-hydrate dehydratase / NAD(P)H-hydrate epimerase